MAKQNTAQPLQPPPNKRIDRILIYNGMWGVSTVVTLPPDGGEPIISEVVSMSATPFVELHAVGCEPLIDPNTGEQATNEFGELCWKDDNSWTGAARVTDPSKLASFLPIWLQLMGAAETELEDIELTKG